MIKIILATTLLALGTFAHSVFATQTYPSNGIFQEMAGTTKNKKITIDLVNSSTYRDTVRIGVRGGEVMFAAKSAGIPNDMIGYKHPFSRNAAAYGLINNSANGSETIMGFAYSAGNSKFRYNFNAEQISPSGGNSRMELKAGVYYVVHTRLTGRMYLTGEIIMDNNAGTQKMYGALRLRPKSNVFVDIGFYESSSTGGGGGKKGGGGGKTTTTTGIPLFFRLTLSL